MSEKLLRKLVSEIQASINIEADPWLENISPEAVEDGLEFSLHLDPSKIKSLVDDAEEQTGKRISRVEKKITDDELEKGALSSLGSSNLKEKFDELGERFGKKFADQAFMFVQRSLKDGSLTPSMLFNPGQVDESGTVEIPPGLRDLARLVPPAGVRGQEKGKGEILASIMFGFDASVAEPDISIPGKGGWHIKSFGSESQSRTVVQSGEGGGVKDAITNFVNKWREHGIEMNINLRKGAIDKIEASIRKSDGEGKAKEFRDDFNALAVISVTEPNGTAKGLLRLNRESSFTFIPANQVAAAGLVKGRLELGRDSIPPTPAAAVSRMRGTVKKESFLRNVVRNLLMEELTKADKKEIDKLIKKGIEKDRAEQKKLIQKELEAELKKSLGQSFFRQPGKIRKTIEDVCRQELAKEMKKGSDLEKSVVAVTKKVLSAWHELLYKQQHIIQRVKI